VGGTSDVTTSLPVDPIDELNEPALYRAVESRDRRFDGRVFVAVTSTGIYCRPVCPVPMPRPQNVRFYRWAAAAEAAGFRPCRRCRPELSPDSPDWDRRADIVGRALDHIARGTVERDGVAGLARRLAVSERHLRRTFQQSLGVSVVQVARSRRAHLARRLLEDTALSSTEVAFMAGFRSVRSYHETMAAVFAAPPLQLRKGPHPADGLLRLRLPYRPPLDWGAVLELLGECAIPGVEEVTGHSYRRVVALGGGPPSIVEVAPTEDGPWLWLSFAMPPSASIQRVVQGMRSRCDLDADLAAIEAALRGDPLLAPLVATRPGVRVPGAFDEFEGVVLAALVRTMPTPEAASQAGQLAAATGTALPQPSGTLTHAFPTPRQAGHARSGTTEAAAATAAIRILQGSDGRPAADPDAFEPEASLLAAAHRAGWRGGPADLVARAEAWRPWRAYAAAHLRLANVAPSIPADGRGRNR